MAITITQVFSDAQTPNQSAYTTATSAVLTAGRHYYVSVVGDSSIAGAPIVSSVQHDASGTPLSFTRVTDGGQAAQTDDYRTDAREARAELWEVHVSSTTANAAITVTFAGTCSAYGCDLFYIEGEEDSGITVQVVKNSGTGTSATATLASFGATDNATFFIVAVNGAGSTITEEEGRSELAQIDDTERATHAVHYQIPNGSDTTLTATVTSADWGTLGIEIQAAGGGGGGGPTPFSRGHSQSVLLGFY